MMSAMSVVASLNQIQVPSGVVGGSAVLNALVTCHRMFGSLISRLKSAVFGDSLGL